MESLTTENIKKHFIKEIENGSISVGQKLDSERQLSKEFKVSRSTIREAIRELNALGYLDTVNKVGTYVCSKYLENARNKSSLKEFIDLAPIIDLMEVRYILESNFVDLAVNRAEKNDFQKLSNLLKKMKSKNITETDYYKYDLDFHYLIAKSTHNVVIVELMKVIRDRIQSNRELFIESGKQTMEKDIALFESIIENMKLKNVKETKKLYDEHLKTVTATIKGS
ncbi:MAG: GntR family transcriptional regulator [Bacillota bacterium]|nr:GntR family transcriptional regulator [Bacillota bacterium]